MTVKIQFDTKELEKAFAEIGPRLATVTARAINETAVNAKAQAEKTVSLRKNIPLKLIRKRLDISGQIKEDRAIISKANKSRLYATIVVYMRGIPVFQLAGKPTKNQRKRPGVKAKGGRFYKSAFYTPGASPFGYVFKRRSVGGLMMPKIGVRKALEAEYYALVTGPNGVRIFQQRWERLAAFELEKINK